MIDVTISWVIEHARWVGTTFDCEMPKQTNDPRFVHVHRAWFTCEVCGCQSGATPDSICGELQLHHEDENALNNESGNVVVVCPFCHGILHFDLMMANRLFPGRLIWAPDIPQSFLTMYAHLRGCAEFGCKALFEKGMRTSADAVTSGEQLQLEIRERLELVGCALEMLDMRDEDFGIEGLADIMTSSPEGFGKAFGTWLRKASVAERTRLARHFAGVRYLFDWRNDPVVPHMMFLEDKESRGAWAEGWVRVVERLADLVRHLRSGGSFDRGAWDLDEEPWYPCL